MSGTQAQTPASGMKRIPFPLESYEHPSLPLVAKRLVNVMAEKQPADARTTAALVSTPGLVPYIPVGALVPPEVGEYEPTAALYSGDDGLNAIRVVERAARRLLRAGGRVAVEHGSPQGAAVYWVFAEESGWQQTRNHKDLAGRDRFVTAVRG